MNNIVITEHDENWTEQYKYIAAQLHPMPGCANLQIDHIGSTAIPGLAAKNVIDIQVTVPDLNHINELASALTALGYTNFPEFTDHVPAGLNDTPDLWKKSFWNRTNSEPKINLHIRQLGLPNQRFALLFRDYLRSYPRMAKSYEAAKKALASSLPDASKYAEAKDPIIDIIMTAAEEWARATNWCLVT